MKDKELCKWLRDNSSGVFRNSELGAIRIEELEQEVIRLEKELKIREELISENLEVKRCTCGKLCKIGYVCTCGNEVD